MRIRLALLAVVALAVLNVGQSDSRWKPRPTNQNNQLKKLLQHQVTRLKRQSPDLTYDEFGFPRFGSYNGIGPTDPTDGGYPYPQPQPQPVYPQPQPQPVYPRPQPQPVYPRPQPVYPRPQPVYPQPEPAPLPQPYPQPQPRPQPVYPHPEPAPAPYPQPQPQPTYPQPGPQPTYPQPAPQPTYPQPGPQPTYPIQPQPHPEPTYPQPQPAPAPDNCYCPCRGTGSFSGNAFTLSKGYQAPNGGGGVVYSNPVPSLTRNYPARSSVNTNDETYVYLPPPTKYGIDDSG